MAEDCQAVWTQVDVGLTVQSDHEPSLPTTGRFLPSRPDAVDSVLRYLLADTKARNRLPRALVADCRFFGQHDSAPPWGSTTGAGELILPRLPHPSAPIRKSRLCHSLPLLQWPAVLVTRLAQ